MKGILRLLRNYSQILVSACALCVRLQGNRLDSGVAAKGNLQIEG
jgi:hypothetical protein